MAVITFAVLMVIGSSGADPMEPVSLILSPDRPYAGRFVPSEEVSSSGGAYLLWITLGLLVTVGVAGA